MKFYSWRQLLAEKNLPFDPDELLEARWQQRLKKKLDQMPELQVVQQGTSEAPAARVATAAPVAKAEMVLLAHVSLGAVTQAAAAMVAAQAMAVTAVLEEAEATVAEVATVGQLI